MDLKNSFDCRSKWNLLEVREEPAAASTSPRWSPSMVRPARPTCCVLNQKNDGGDVDVVGDAEQRFWKITNIIE